MNNTGYNKQAVRANVTQQFDSATVGERQMYVRTLGDRAWRYAATRTTGSPYGRDGLHATVRQT